MKTYFTDTNYFLRFILKDDLLQSAQVYKLFEKGLRQQVILITSDLVFIEIGWVLSSYYKKPKSECINCLNKILSLSFIHYESKKLLLEAMRTFQSSGLRLEDCYNIAFARENKVDRMATFDKKLKSAY